MTKYDLYRYLGVNGVIESPVYIDGIYSIKLCKMVAASGHLLTDGNERVQTITVPASEIDKWVEVEA